MRRRSLLVAFVIFAACGEPYEGEIPTPAPDRDGSTTEEDGGDGGTTLDDAAADASDADASIDPCDEDEDGFRAVACDAGDAGDCDDEDNRVHPDAGFRADPPATSRDGDWNCDGTVQKRYAVFQSCPALGGTNCLSLQGFVGDPACGTSSTYIFCKTSVGGCVIDDTKTEQRTQECK